MHVGSPPILVNDALLGLVAHMIVIRLPISFTTRICHSERSEVPFCIERFLLDASAFPLWRPASCGVLEVAWIETLIVPLLRSYS